MGMPRFSFGVSDWGHTVMVAASAKRAAKTLDFDQKLIELPRAYSLTATEFGFTKGPPEHYLAKYANKDFRKVVDDALQIFLELMFVTKSLKVSLDTTGQPIMEDVVGFDEMGREAQFSEAKEEWRSHWSVRHTDCGGNEGNPRPAPGHWKTFVERNWRLILPHLRFTSTRPSKNRTEKMIENQMDPDKNDARRDGLLAIAFILEKKEGERKTSWTGED